MATISRDVRAHRSVVRATRSRLRLRLRTWVALFLGIAVASSAVTIGVTVSQRTLSALVGESISVGTSLQFVLKGVDVVVLTAGAAGDTQGGAIEMATVLGAASTSVTGGNWKYVAEVKEAAAGSLTGGTFKAELFQNGVSKGSLFMKQATPDAGTIEGVTFTWDVGSSVANAHGFRVEVTQVA